MSFFEERLPDCYSFGARGGPVFSTEVVRTAGGQRYANKNWLLPIHRYDISSGIKTRDDFEVLRAFFYNVAGQFDGFRFKDWADYQADRQPTVLVSGAIYQMQRSYIRGIRTFKRTISKPVSGTVIFYRTRAGVTSTISPTIDYTTGQVTVAGHVAGDAYTWSGEFDVPVAFTSDAMEREIVDKNAEGLLIGWPSVQIEEIRL
ncbi:MAG: DUF2460 domain-containing protein [Planctomycetota bacterium]